MHLPATTATAFRSSAMWHCTDLLAFPDAQEGPTAVYLRYQAARVELSTQTTTNPIYKCCETYKMTVNFYASWSATCSYLPALCTVEHSNTQHFRLPTCAVTRSPKTRVALATLKTCRITPEHPPPPRPYCTSPREQTIKAADRTKCQQHRRQENKEREEEEMSPYLSHLRTTSSPFLGGTKKVQYGAQLRFYSTPSLSCV